MDQRIKEKLVLDIANFEAKKASLSATEAELALLEILTPLLRSEGYKVEYTGEMRNNEVDFTGTRQQKTLGIEFKHILRPIGASEIRMLIGRAVLKRLSKIVLLTSSSFSTSARIAARQINPISIELMDIPALKTWIGRIQANYDESEVIKVLRTFTQEIIRLIEKNPLTLAALEWRDMERVLAELFRGLGFDVELTPASKDGGKDIILECLLNGTSNSFIVEIKHWRSGQRVGQTHVRDFVNVVAKEKRQGGLYLSTYGYTENAVESLTEIERKMVRLGDENKIISLSQTYIKKKAGLWTSDQELPQILFDKTT